MPGRPMIAEVAGITAAPPAYFSVGLVSPGKVTGGRLAFLPAGFQPPSLSPVVN